MAEWSFSIGAWSFNLVDIIIVVIVLVTTITATVRGFAQTLSKRLGFLIGLVVALFYAHLLANLLVETFELPLLWSTLIAFAVIFIVVYLLIIAFGKLLSKALEAVRLNFLNRILGAALGIVEAFVIVAVIVYLLNLQKVINVEPYFAHSFLITRVVAPLTPIGVGWVKGLL
ncbi:MAG: CvpA family protein [Sphaerochaetaceae bacterium]|jgi:membrane protein required for colicin V production